MTWLFHFLKWIETEFISYPFIQSSYFDGFGHIILLFLKDSGFSHKFYQQDTTRQSLYIFS